MLQAICRQVYKMNDADIYFLAGFGTGAVLFSLCFGAIYVSYRHREKRRIRSVYEKEFGHAPNQFLRTKDMKDAIEKRRRQLSYINNF